MAGKSPHHDCVIVGASFAGLACATALALAGRNVKILERKSDLGEKLHTTGIIVKEAAEQSPMLAGLPPSMVHIINGVRLYAPNLRHVDLSSPGYYFLATDTPAVLRWLAQRAEAAGARIAYADSFTGAELRDDSVHLHEGGTANYLVGADGPGSRVAREFGLGSSTEFLTGIEYEYATAPLGEPELLHCFIDRQIAPGYIGWVVAGVGVTQVGLARRMKPHDDTARSAMERYLKKIAPIFKFSGQEPVAVRAGRIPCGGLVRPLATNRVLLVGDAAGMVSPVTAGGIHTALKHGWAAGEAVAAFLSGSAADPAGWFVRSYPTFRMKRILRTLFDNFQSDFLFNLMLSTPLMRAAAELVYFHHQGVFRKK